MLAGFDRPLRGADDLVVAPHRRARRDGPHRYLVAGRHQAGDRDALVREHGPADELMARDHDIVGGVDAEGEGVCHGVLWRERKSHRRVTE